MENLIFRYNYKPEKGIIYLRLDEYAPQEPGLIVEDIITNVKIDLTLALTVIEKNGIRWRKYLMEPPTNTNHQMEAAHYNIREYQ